MNAPSNPVIFMRDDVPMWQYLIWAMEKRDIMRTQDISRRISF
jgi:hypothetical protein